MSILRKLPILQLPIRSCSPHFIYAILLWTLCFLSSLSSLAMAENTTFTASLEQTILPEKNGLPVAKYVSFSYLKTASDTVNRPITFLFNGGPGSASHWLHLGGIGPYTAEQDTPGSFIIIPNEHSLIQDTDLVFIDPIGTGYSTAEKGSASAFWGVIEDAKSITDLIITWLIKNGRLDSPLYIMGESYGTLRATLIADELLRAHKKQTAGLILLSAAQNYRNIRLPDGSVMGYISYLPTYAAAAWHHRKLAHQPKSLSLFLEEVRSFSAGEYATALIKGNRLTAKEKVHILQKLVRYTGLKTEYLAEKNLRVKPLEFLKTLLADNNLKLSRLDGRMSGTLQKNPQSHGGTHYGTDPYALLLEAPFAAATNTYLKQHFNVSKMAIPYVTSARTHPEWRWNWNVWGEENIPSGSRYINVIPNLERTLIHTPKMQVMVAAGYYDFTTPFFSVENSFSELETRQERVHYSYYSAGHLIYLDRNSRGKLTANIRAFIQNSTQKQ